MEQVPSRRLIDQRVRNRVIEAVHTLSMGNEGVRQVWPDAYFEDFYTWIPHRSDGHPQSNSAITAEEQASLLALSKILDDACDATPKIMTADQFIVTGWPKRIQLVAQEALALMLRRGRFDEMEEEARPSSTEAWSP